MRRYLVPVLAMAACALSLAPRVAQAGENYVFVRTNPLAFAVHGEPMSPRPGGGETAWNPDLFGLGFNHGKLEISFNLTSQNPFPATGEFSVLQGRLSAAFRPLKKGQINMVDPYIFAGAGLGGAGDYVKKDAACENTTQKECAMARNGWGGGLHGGVGLDFTFPLFTIDSSQQRISAFVGLEFRGEFFYAASSANLYAGYSVPFGLRLD